MTTIESNRRINFNRKISGMSAILLPFKENGEVDWIGFRKLLERTTSAGLVPAVNMDTGYGPFLATAARSRILEMTREVCDGSFVAGAFIGDLPNSKFNLRAYVTQTEEIQQLGGTPIIFQSFGLAHGVDDEIIENYQLLAKECDEFLAFELGSMFANFGLIYSLDVFRELLKIKQCVGAKHSSLNRKLEWERLLIRDDRRPDFKILTGNDLAIDMVMYGSDYLLGLSTFCPEMFAKRDRMWESGDSTFYELNDQLQYLGAFAFRHPTSAYKHNAAMFLYQSGGIESDSTHPKCQQRPASDRAILHEIGKRLGIEMLPERI